MRIKKQSGRTYWAIAFGVLQAVIISVLLAALSAVFIDNESVGIHTIPFIAMIAWFASSFMCAFYSGRKGEGRWVVHSIIATGIYIILLLGAGILIFDGLSGSIFPGLISGALGCLLSIFIQFKRMNKPVNRKLRKFTAH